MLSQTKSVKLSLYLTDFIIALFCAAAFFSLILRVIKNVFRSAIEIKAENELTI